MQELEWMANRTCTGILEQSSSPLLKGKNKILLAKNPPTGTVSRDGVLI
jgi:hypothetical protein